MKIGLVAPGGFDPGGRERVIPVLLWLIERLARTHEVHVFTLYQPAEPAPFRLCGATVHTVPPARPPLRMARRFGQTLERIRGEHRRARFDVLHGLWASESGLFAGLCGRSLGVPGVVSIVGGELARLPEIGYGGCISRKGRALVALALRAASRVTASTEYSRAPLRARGIQADLIPLGVALDRFAPPPAPPSGPPHRLLHIASLNRVKDQPTLLAAMARLRARIPSIRLDVVGIDTLDGAMQRLAVERGVADCVTFHGERPGHEVAALLQQAHLLVHSSRHESGPMVFLEAAACGVPAVGTAVGYFADLAPERAGCVPVGGAEALANEAATLLQDEDRRQQTAAAAREWGAAHDADWTARRFEALYASLANRGISPDER